MRVAGGEIEMAVRADGAGRAGGDAELAFKTRIKVKRLGVGRDLGRDDNRSEQHEAAEARMNHIAMDAHLPETGCHRDRFVGNDPKPAGVPAIGLHRKSGGAPVDRADAGCVECPHDPPRDVVHLVARVMKFEIGNRAHRRADIFPVHPAHDTDQRLAGRKQRESVASMGGEIGMIDRHEADIVGSGFEAQGPQPIRVQDSRRPRVFRERRANALHSRVIGKLHHGDLHKPVYTATYAGVAPARGLRRT